MTSEATACVEAVLATHPNLGPADINALADAYLDLGLEFVSAVVRNECWTPWYGAIRTRDDLEGAVVALAEMYRKGLPSGRADLREAAVGIRHGQYARSLQLVEAAVGKDNDLWRYVSDLWDAHWHNDDRPWCSSDALEWHLGLAGWVPTDVRIGNSICVGYRRRSSGPTTVVSWNVDGVRVVDLKALLIDGRITEYREDVASLMIDLDIT